MVHSYCCALSHCRTSKRLSLTAPTKSWSWSTKERQLQCGVALCCTARASFSTFLATFLVGFFRSFVVPPDLKSIFPRMSLNAAQISNLSKRFLKPKLKSPYTARHVWGMQDATNGYKWHMFTHVTGKKTMPLCHIQFLQVSSTELLLQLRWMPPAADRTASSSSRCIRRRAWDE